MYCPNCGMEIKVNSKYCGECGQEITNIKPCDSCDNSRRKLDITDGIIIITSLTVLLSMVLLPILSFPGLDEKKWLLKDCICGSWTNDFILKDSPINTTSPIIFALMSIMVIITLVSVYYKKYGIGGLASSVNIILIVIYLLTSNVWYNEMMWNEVSTHEDVALTSGFILILLASLICSFICTSIKVSNNQRNSRI
jgi:hypothetical protein